MGRRNQVNTKKAFSSRQRSSGPCNLVVAKINEKTKASIRLPVSTLLFFCSSPVRRSLPVRKSGEGHMYTWPTPILYPEAHSAESRLRSAPFQFYLSVCAFAQVPLGFCFGGFTSTAGYVPGNEALRTSKSEDQVFAGRLWHLSG